MAGINYDAIRRRIPNQKRLRKSNWVSGMSLNTAIRVANDYLKDKKVTLRGEVYFNIQVEAHKSRVVTMPEGEYYYYQLVTFDRLVSWEKGYDEVVATHTEL